MDIKKQIANQVKKKNAADKYIEKNIIKVNSLLRNLRLEIAAEISRRGLEINQLPAYQSILNDYLLDYERRFRLLLDANQADLFRDGIDAVDAGFSGSDIFRQRLVVPVIDDTLITSLARIKNAYIKGISNEIRDKIFNQITLGTSGGLNITQVIQNIGTSITKGTFKTVKLRAETIARTEMHRVLKKAEEIREKQITEEFDTLKSWLSSRDDRVRRSHWTVDQATSSDLGGTPIPFKKDFDVNGNKAAGPYDSRLPASEVINCRCEKIIIIPELQ